MADKDETKAPAEPTVDPRQLMPLENKLAEIRKALLENPDLEDLKRLQVHAGLLENALVNATNYHHHDTNLHHDHDTMVLMPGLEPRRIQR